MTKLASDRMRAGERRPLTAGEVELARVLFGDEIKWPQISVLQAPAALGFGAMVPRGRTIVFCKWRAARDFSKAGVGEQGWFVHELMHVWQAARGVTLAAAKLNALGKSAYVYKPMKAARLKQFNIERQAEIARHLWLARVGAMEPGMPDRAWLEEVWATR